MDTQVLKAQVMKLTEKVLQESANLPHNKQYNTEYAMQHIGRVLADIRRIEAWHSAVVKWQGKGLMTDTAPTLKNFVQGEIR